MNENLTNLLTGLTGALLLTWFGFEVSRRRKKLRELYNVLDHDDRAMTLHLEALVKSGEIKPL